MIGVVLNLELQRKGNQLKGKNLLKVLIYILRSQDSERFI